MIQSHFLSEATSTGFLGQLSDYQTMKTYRNHPFGGPKTPSPSQLQACPVSWDNICAWEMERNSMPTMISSQMIDAKILSAFLFNQHSQMISFCFEDAKFIYLKKKRNESTAPKWSRWNVEIPYSGDGISWWNRSKHAAGPQWFDELWHMGIYPLVNIYIILGKP